MEKKIAEFSLVKKVSLTDRVHDQILELIIKNAASEEEMVLTEKRLTELFGVSKAPVREALIKLCTEGALVNVPRYGYRVIRMSEKDARDVLQVRTMLEIEALRASFDYIGENELRQMQEQITCAATKQNVDVWQVWEDNEEFHLLLASFSNNKILLRLLRDCMGIQKRIYAQHKWNELSSMVDSVEHTPHCGICGKLAEKDLEGVIRLLREDIQGSM